MAGALDCGLGAGAGVFGSSGAVVSSRLDSVSAREHLLGSQALSGDGVDDTGGLRVVEVCLLVVEECLVFIAGALGVVEDVLGGGSSCLGESGLDLPAFLVCHIGVVGRAGVDLVVELGLLLVEALLLAISDRLLTVS